MTTNHSRAGKLAATLAAVLAGCAGGHVDKSGLGPNSGSDAAASDTPTGAGGGGGPGGSAGSGAGGGGAGGGGGPADGGGAAGPADAAPAGSDGGAAGGAGGGAPVGPDAGPEAPAPGTRGAPCAAAADCMGPACADGVCCDSACDGACRSCHLTGRVGTCAPVTSGADDACTAVGAGYACTVSGACRRGRGLACATDDDCVSRRCVDGVCCDGACAGVCQACNLPGKEGTCTTVISGPDAPSCAAPQTCSAAGKCVNRSNGAACTAPGDCASGFCVDHLCCDVACAGTCTSCDGRGSAPAGTCGLVDRNSLGRALACIPYHCSGTSAACATTCDGDSQCWISHYCDAPAGGTCVAKKSAGAACAPDPFDPSGNHQCNSGHCTAATGTCAS